MPKTQSPLYLLLLSGMVLLPVSLLTSQENVTHPKTSEYIDSAACSRCHYQIYQSYKSTPMGQSLSVPSASNTIENYTEKNEYYHAVSDTHFSMKLKDGVPYQRRWQVAADGSEINTEELKIDYIVGAGMQARSYLHRNARGMMIELPLGWYSEKSGYWALSPGFDSRHPQTRRFTSYECLFCHTAYPKIDKTAAQGSDPIFANGLPEGIDCQRCHGPGAQHVRTAQTPGATLPKIRAAIVNPAKLEPKRQMEVCMQCHLEPTSGELPSLIRRFNREPYSYVAGQPLEEFIRYFDYMPGTEQDDRFELVSAAYRLRKSKCFLQSKQPLTCLNCHDPHKSLPTGSDATATYSKACLQCHQPDINTLVSAGKHTNSNDCTSCHMPKRRTEDVVHAIVTDHLIQRRPPNKDLLSELQEKHSTDTEKYRGRVVPYYPSSPSKTSEDKLYDGVAQVALENNVHEGIEQLSSQLRLTPSKHPEFYKTLGDALKSNNQIKEAIAAYQQAVQLNPTSIAALQSLSSALSKSGDTRQSEQFLLQALRLSPEDPSLLYQHALLDIDRGNPGAALTTLQKVLSLNPDQPNATTTLADAYARLGRFDEAETAIKKSLSIDPFEAATYDLNGQLHAARGSNQEALASFQKATQLRPASGAYRYDYALMLVRSNRLEEARAQAQAAVDADPNSASAHYLLGGLLTQQPEQAITEYQRALELKPDLAQAHLGLALLLLNRNNINGATEHLQKAVAGNDAAVARQASQLLQRIQR